jgi:hypothetical protein
MWCIDFNCLSNVFFICICLWRVFGLLLLVLCSFSFLSVIQIVEFFQANYRLSFVKYFADPLLYVARNLSTTHHLQPSHCQMSPLTMLCCRFSKKIVTLLLFRTNPNSTGSPLVQGRLFLGCGDLSRQTQKTLPDKASIEFPGFGEDSIKKQMSKKFKPGKWGWLAHN